MQSSLTHRRSEPCTPLRCRAADHWGRGGGGQLLAGRRDDDLLARDDRADAIGQLEVIDCQKDKNIHIKLLGQSGTTVILFHLIDLWTRGRGPVMVGVGVSLGVGVFEAVGEGNSRRWCKGCRGSRRLGGKGYPRVS